MCKIRKMKQCEKVEKWGNRKNEENDNRKI